MKKSLKKWLVFISFFSMSGLVATACTDNEQVASTSASDQTKNTNQDNNKVNEKNSTTKGATGSGSTDGSITSNKPSTQTNGNTKNTSGSPTSSSLGRSEETEDTMHGGGAVWPSVKDNSIKPSEPKSKEGETVTDSDASNGAAKNTHNSTTSGQEVGEASSKTGTIKMGGSVTPSKKTEGTPAAPPAPAAAEKTLVTKGPGDTAEHHGKDQSQVQK